MKRHEKFEYGAIGFVLGVALLSLFIAWCEFPKVPEPKHETDAIYEGTQREKEREEHYWIHNRLRGYVYTEDTLAQWIMSAFAGAATVVSVFGLVWIKRTLFETRRTADEATKANLQAREIGRKQLRGYPWVSFSEIKETKVGQKPYAFIKIKNYGQTPISITENLCWFNLAHFPNHGALPEPELPQSRQSFIIGPGAEMSLFPRCGTELTLDIRNGLVAGTYIIFVYGRLRYVDIFGDEHSMRYCLKKGGDIGFDREALAWHYSGNEASYLQDNPA